MADQRDAHAPSSGEILTLVGTSARALAFRRLSEGHLAASYRLARAIVDDAGEAEDAVHDAFVQAWRQWPSLRDQSRFDQWFDRILINTCRNLLRKRARSRVVDLSPGLAIAQSGDQYQAASDRDELALALTSLDADHRLVVALRYYSDLTVDQIAARTGLRSGTVKSRLHYALLRLHSVLDETRDPGGHV